MNEIFWIVHGKLAGRRFPSTDELRALHKAGFRIVVALEKRDDIQELEQIGFEVYSFEIEDYTAPSITQLEEFNKIVKEAGEFDNIVKEAGKFNRIMEEAGTNGAKGKPILVHCKGGYGRTGTMLAGYLIREEGCSAEEAIRFVRERRPGAVEAEEQVKILHDYESWLGRKK